MTCDLLGAKPLVSELLGAKPLVSEPMLAS